MEDPCLVRGGRSHRRFPGAPDRAAGVLRAYPQELRGQFRALAAGIRRVRPRRRSERELRAHLRWGRLPGRRPVLADSGVGCASWAWLAGSCMVADSARYLAPGGALGVDLRVGDLPWIVADLLLSRPWLRAAAGDTSRPASGWLKVRELSGAEGRSDKACVASAA